MPRAGGVLDQPLNLLARIHAIDVVYATLSYIDAEGSDYNKLTPTQVELVRWLETNTDGK